MLKTVGNPSTRSGDQTIVSGNLIIGTAGKGIDFSADGQAAGMTSEVLDDYEEGTFTPVIVADVTPGTGTYAVQIGTYTKVGNRVSFSIHLNWSAHTGAGEMRISGLPFVPASRSPVSFWLSAIILNANSVIQGYVNLFGTNIALEQYVVGGSNSATVALDTSGQFMVSGQYEV
jgi:hypothetical protein